jgi:hypothetical protein
VAKTELPDDRPEPTLIALKDPLVAGGLAWFWPGAGHLYQGRIAKGVLFMVCILATFAYGQYLGRGRVVFVYNRNFQPERFRWPYLCQFWVGLPALPAIVQARRTPKFGEEMFSPAKWYMPPENLDEFDSLHKHLHRLFELGTVFTMIAGLLNVLAIYDAVGGPAYYHEKERDDEAAAARDGPKSTGA